jgi:hypothetical protein
MTKYLESIYGDKTDFEMYSRNIPYFLKNNGQLRIFEKT